MIGWPLVYTVGYDFVSNQQSLKDSICSPLGVCNNLVFRQANNGKVVVAVLSQIAIS